MKTLLIFALAAAAFAQNTPVFPARVATNQDLLVASNLFATKLSASIGPSDTRIPVASVLGFKTPGAISIGNEIIEVCSTSGPAFVVCAGGRGFDGTSAAPALWTTVVRGLIVADHHNQPAAEILAIETALGPGMLTFETAINQVPLAAYNYSRSPSGSLTAGIGAAIVMSPCPLGVTAASGNPLPAYIAGTGTPEVAAVTGGSCTPGAATGTYVVTPANSHAAGYSISSATIGIQEYIDGLGAAGGTLTLPAATLVQLGQISIPSHVHLIGAGESATAVQLSGASYTGNFGPKPAWLIPGFPVTYSSIVFALGASDSSIESMTVDKNAPATAYASGGAIGGVNNSFIRLERLKVINSSNAHIGTPVVLQGNASNIVVRSVQIINQPGCVLDNDGPAGFNFGGANNVITDSYVTNVCATGYLVGNNGVVKGNTLIVGAGTMSALNQAFSADSTSGSVWDSNICDGTGNLAASGPACYTAFTDTPGISADNVTITSNIARNCGIGVYLAILTSNAGTHSNGDIVKGNQVTNCGYGVLWGDYVSQLLVADNVITGALIDGIETFTLAANTANFVDIHDNMIINPVQAGMFFNVNGVWSPGTNYKIHHNTILDTQSPHVMTAGIWLPKSTIYAGWEISDNTSLGALLPFNDIFLLNGPSTVSSLHGNITDASTAATNGVASSLGMTAVRAGLAVPISGTVNNNVLIHFAGNIRLTNPGGALSTPFSISGFAGETGSVSGVDGEQLEVCNYTGQTVTYQNQNGGSSAPNQIYTGTLADVAAPHACTLFIYDAASGLWGMH